MLLPLATPDRPLTTPCQCCLYSISLTRLDCVSEGWGLCCLWGVETHRGTLLGHELALWKVATPFFYFPIFLFYISFFFLLCSLFVAFAKLCPVYFSISAQGIYQFLSRSVWPRRSRKCVQSWQLSSCEICGPPDDFCLAFLWSWMADRSVPPTWQLS